MIYIFKVSIRFFFSFKNADLKTIVKKMLNFKKKPTYISTSNEMVDKILSMLTVCTD